MISWVLISPDLLFWEYLACVRVAITKLFNWAVPVIACSISERFLVGIFGQSCVFCVHPSMTCSPSHSHFLSDRRQGPFPHCNSFMRNIVLIFILNPSIIFQSSALSGSKIWNCIHEVRPRAAGKMLLPLLLLQWTGNYGLNRWKI